MNPWKRWVALFEDKDDPAEPHYDPVHLAVVLIACQVAAGALFWLLWTLLVYEGGLASKIAAALAARAGAPARHDALEGWPANAAAFALVLLIVALLQKADRRAAKRAR